MARDFETEVKITLKDDASPRVRTLSDEFRRMQSARETLGIRSERNIQREIMRTTAAYNRMERSGVLSANEQSRAYEKMQSTVGRLRKEMEGAERQQRQLGKGMLSIGAGVVAGAMTLRKPISDQISLSHAEAELSNIAFKDRDVAGRIAGKKEIDQALRTALREGGSPDEGISALTAMIRTGMDFNRAREFLPEVMRNATATNSSPESMANLAASAENFGLSKKDSMTALSVATTAAQNGRVDVPILASEMPRALEAAKSAGFRGQKGYAQVAALFQASALGAGSPEEAATNTNSLLAELTSANLSNNAKRLKIRGKGVDIQALEVQDAKAGLTPLDTVNKVVDSALKYDPKYQTLTKQLAGTHDEESRDRIESQRDLIEGGYVSRLFPNQQARNAFLNLRRQRPYFQRVQDEEMEQFHLPEGHRSADLDFGLIQQEPEFQLHQAANAKLFASNDVVAPISKALGNVAETGSKLAEEFPRVSTAAAGAAMAITALGAAAAAKAGVGMILGGGAADVAAGAAGGAASKGLLSKAWGVTKNGLSKGKNLFKPGSLLTGAGMYATAAAGNDVVGILQSMSDGRTYNGIQGHSGEMGELARLKMQNLKANGGTEPLPALNEMNRWSSASSLPPSLTPVEATNTPAPSPINLTVQLDGHDIAASVQQRMERDSRRQ
jgi:TP901 family phage tail tape measure protein